MNRLISIILVVLLGLVMRGQELEIVGFEETLDVMTADHQRKDLNGNVCALVQVNLPIEGASFSGNIIGDVTFDVNTYNVYMTQGSKVIEIKCPGFLSQRISFSEYEIPSLESKRVYKLQVLPHRLESVNPSNSLQNSLIQNTSATIANHEYVDLGLPSGTKWANCNIGADTPEEYGRYYSWGEIYEPSDGNYSASNCRLNKKKTIGNEKIMDIGGNSEYDAASENWGSEWKMPSKTQWEELKNKCKWKWTTQKGINGILITGPNGNTIFLPAGGGFLGTTCAVRDKYGFYWTSTPKEGDSSKAITFNFNSQSIQIGSDHRDSGYSIRPVLK